MHFTFTSCYIRVVFVYRRIDILNLVGFVLSLCTLLCCMVEWLQNLKVFAMSTRSGSQRLRVQLCRLRALV